MESLGIRCANPCARPVRAHHNQVLPVISSHGRPVKTPQVPPAGRHRPLQRGTACSQCPTLPCRAQPDFRRLVLAQIFIYMSFLVIDTTGFYLNVFYVNGGDMGVGAGMKGWYGTAFQLCGLLAVPLIAGPSSA